MTDPGLILVGSQNVNIGLPHPDKPPPAVRDVIWQGTEEIIGVEITTAS